MIRSIFALYGVLTCGTAYADHERYPLWSGPDNIPLGDSSTASGFSIGTLAGVGITTYSANTYRVQDNVVVLDHHSTAARRIQPATFILPSYVIGRIANNPLAVIVPLGASASSGDIKLSYGIGLSYGLTESKSVELGLSVSAIWTPYPTLNDQQQISFNDQTPLPSGASFTIDTENKITVVIGLYVAPKI